MKIFRGLRERLNRKKSKHENPSVDDYKNKDELVYAMTGTKPGKKDAMENVLPPSSSRSVRSSVSSNNDDQSLTSAGSGTDQDDFTPVEWTLPLVDEEASEPQSMEEELKRLQVLQNYFILDSQGEDEFDRITRLASKMFDVPICLVSLVDLGRQWFLSRVGLDATETPRKVAFCAHVVINKYKMLIVPDATKDDRFKDNPLVKDGLKIRFYAGFALVSPEGYKLGTLCLISPISRPGGLSEAQQDMLHEMAGMVVNAMVARRNRLLKEEYESRFHDLAKTLYETNQTMDNARKTIDQILYSASSSMDIDDAFDLGAAARTLGVQSEICSAAIRHVIEDTPAPKKPDDEAEEELDAEAFTMAYDKIVNPTTDMEKLFDNVNTVVANFPIKYPVTVEMDKSVPKFITVEDLLVFRCTLNLLTHCMGSSEGKTGMRIKSKKKSNELLIQCVKGGDKLVSASAAKELFSHKDSLLAPVASMVRTLGGRYGMREGTWEDSEIIQSIFWFQIPYGLPESSSPSHFTKSLRKVHHIGPGKQAPPPTKDINMDPFQAALLDAGCGNRRLLQ